MTDFASDAEQDAALRLAMARQHLAATMARSPCPPWDGLGDYERDMILIEAREWLRAADNAGLTRRHETDPAESSACNEAVARFLAQAGAVHPKVHTPTRIINYLEAHGWRRIESPKPPYTSFWSPPDPGEMRWAHPSGIELDAPLHDDVPRYAEAVRGAVDRIVWAAAGQPLATPPVAVTEVLLEIAQQPDEVAW